MSKRVIMEMSEKQARTILAALEEYFDSVWGRRVAAALQMI